MSSLPLIVDAKEDEENSDFQGDISEYDSQNQSVGDELAVNVARKKSNPVNFYKDLTEILEKEEEEVGSGEENT